MTRTAIVVEGGAMRGIFAAGVLDVFHEREGELGAFDFAIGSSAGACNLASHLARQVGRNRRCYLTQMLRSEFIDARRFARGGHWLDLDYLWDAFDREDPLDVHAATSHSTKLIVAATSIATGRPRYLEPTAGELNEVLRASCAVPILYRRFVEVDGEHYADGGIAAPIPVAEAYRRGARRILVIRSRPAAFPGPSRAESALGAMLLRRHRGLSRALLRYPDIYARSCAFIAAPPPGCQIIHVAPESLRTSRTTQDAAILEADYQQGRAAAVRALAEWTRR